MYVYIHTHAHTQTHTHGWTLRTTDQFVEEAAPYGLCEMQTSLYLT